MPLGITRLFGPRWVRHPDAPPSLEPLLAPRWVLRPRGVSVECAYTGLRCTAEADETATFSPSHQIVPRGIIDRAPMPVNRTTSFALFLVLLATSASAQRPLRGLTGIPLLGLSTADFGRFFDSSAAVPPLAAEGPSPAPLSVAHTVDRLIKRREAHGYDALIKTYSQNKGLDPRLVKSVIAAESEFTAHARSPAGAIGRRRSCPLPGHRRRVEEGPS